MARSTGGARRGSDASHWLAGGRVDGPTTDRRSWSPAGEAGRIESTTGDSRVTVVGVKDAAEKGGPALGSTDSVSPALREDSEKRTDDRRVLRYATTRSNRVRG